MNPEQAQDLFILNPPPTEAKDLSKESPTQEEILIQVKEKAKEEKTKVVSHDNSFLKKLIEVKKEEPGGGTSAPQSSGDAKSRLGADIPSLSGTTNTGIASGDSDGTSELIIELLDWVLVEAITYYSCAESSRDYETDVNKKRILKKYLAEYLKKKAANYPVEYLLLAAFLSTYFMSARRAHADRKVNHPIKQAKIRLKKEAAQQSEERKKRKKKESEQSESEVK